MSYVLIIGAKSDIAKEIAREYAKNGYNLYLASRQSIFLNCFVPMFHVLGFVLPRQTTANSYESPFLLKAHCGRWFSCEMGVMDSVEINKGGQGRLS